MVVSDALWGGQLTSVLFDPVTHSCELRVVVTTDGVEITYAIQCDRVSSVHFQNGIPEPWEYAEVTEAELTTDTASGLTTLDLMLWSEDAKLAISATSISIVPA